MKDENPLDLEKHEDETPWDVWKRRLIFGLLIVLCITFAAPTFGSCSSAFESGERVAEFRLGSTPHIVGDVEYRDVQRRLYQTYVVLFQQAPNDDDAYWRHMLLDAAAQDQRIHVSDETATAFIASFPAFQVGGQFDEGQYLATVSAQTNNQLTHKDLLRTVKEMMRGQEYTRLYLNALSPQKKQDAFAIWQNENERLTVEYVVQEFEPIANEIAATDPTDAELSAFVTLPSVEARLRLPARKVVEAAFIRVRDITAAQKAELETFLTERGDLNDEVRLSEIAKQEYAGAASAVYTQDNWRRTQKRLWNETKALLQKDWKARGNEGEIPAADLPPNPDDVEWPENTLAAYEKFWRDPVEREVLARMFVGVVAERAEREGLSFADLLTDYATYGLAVVRNDQPLPDAEITEAFPDGLGRNSEFGPIVFTHLKGPAPGEPFTPVVYVEPVPTTQLAASLDDRGFMVLRLADFEPARSRRVDESPESREAVLAMWREHRTHELAKGRLERIRDAVTAGSTLADAAAAEGLTVATLQRMNLSTPSRAEPKPPPGAQLDAATAEVARRLRHRNRVLADYRSLRTTEAGQFRSGTNVLTDERTGASYLIRVVAKELPTELEMTEADLRRVQGQQSSALMETWDSLLGMDALKRRFQFRELKSDRPATEDDDGTDEGAGDETGKTDDQ